MFSYVNIRGDNRSVSSLYYTCIITSHHARVDKLLAQPDFRLRKMSRFDRYDKDKNDLFLINSLLYFYCFI